MNWFLSLLTPLLLHMAVSEITAAAFGRFLDSAGCATLTAVIVIPVAVWMCQKDGTELKPEKINRKSILLGICCVAGGAVLNVLWSTVLNGFHVQKVFSNQTQEQLLSSAVCLQVLGLGVLVPVAEELIFRALIYCRLRRGFGAALAVFFSALLFAVYHGNPIQMLYAFPMAVILALLFEKSRSVIFPILFHMGANLITVLFHFIG